MGDANVECYVEAMQVLLKLKNMLEPMSAVKDGLGVSERDSSEGSFRNGRAAAVEETPVQTPAGCICGGAVRRGV